MVPSKLYVILRTPHATVQATPKSKGYIGVIQGYRVLAANTGYIGVYVGFGHGSCCWRSM